MHCHYRAPPHLEATAMHPPNPPSPLDAPTPLPSLPNEVLLDIIRLSPPLKAFDFWSTHTSALRSYALVNRQWRGLAQAELFAQVHLRSKQNVNDLVRLFEKEPSLATLCTSLKVLPEAFAVAEIAELVASMKRVKLIWTEYALRVVLWDLLSAPVEYKELESDYHGPGGADIFPRRSFQLSILSSCVEVAWTPLLPPNPRLKYPPFNDLPFAIAPTSRTVRPSSPLTSFHNSTRSASAATTDRPPADGMSALHNEELLHELIVALGPQLTSLQVNLGALKAVQDVFPSLVNLKMLGTPIDLDLDLVELLDPLHRPLVGLYGPTSRRASATKNWRHLAKLFKEHLKADPFPPCLQRLEHVFLHG